MTVLNIDLQGLRPLLSLLIFGLFAINACNWTGCDECNFTEIRGFTIDEDGTKFISTDNGLFCFSSEGWERIASDIIASETGDLDIAENRLWMGTEMGLLNVDADTLVTSSNSGLLSNDVRFINILENGNFYLATADGATVCIQGQWYDTIGRDEELLLHPATDIATASNNFTYITTSGGGVTRFFSDVDGISGATIFDTDWSGLRSNNVHTVHIQDTVQYYGTDEGVAIHYSEYTKWDWANLRNYDGLVSDTVISIIMDQDETLWFGTYKGLSRYDNETWTTFTRASHQLLSDTIAFMALDPSGLIWIADPKGFTSFDGQEFIHYLK